MDRGGSSRLQRHRMRLINELDLHKDSILEKLAKSNILDQTTVDRIRSQPTSHGSSRALLDVLVIRGSSGYESFVEALSDEYPWLVNILENQEKVGLFRDIPNTPADTKRHIAERLNNRGNFVGRQKQLGRIKELFNDSEHVAIVGTGGVGKSELALEYGYRERLTYQLVRWIDADKETILASLIDFAIDMGIDIKSETIEEVIQLLHSQLRRLDSYLLIFDNASEGKELESTYLPHASARKSRQHVLLTGRTLKGFSKLQLDTFSEDDCRKFVDAHINNKDESKSRMESTLGCHPLNLNLAVSYIKTVCCSVDEYFESFDKTRVGLVGVEFGLDDSEQLLLKAWITSLKKLKEVNEKAVILLLWCCVVFPENIPIELFAQSHIFGGMPEVRSALQALRDFSLAHPSPQAGFIYIDRLLLNIINCTLYVPNKRMPVLMSIDFLTDVLQPLLESMTQICPKDISRTADAKLLQYILPHIRAFDKLLEDPKLVSASASINQFRIYELHDDLLTLYEEVLKLFDDNERSETVFRKLLEIRKGRYGILHVNVGCAHAELGNFLRKTGNMSEARDELERAVAIQSRHLGYENDDLGSTLLQLGIVLVELEDYFEAKRILEQSLKIKEHVYGKESAEYAEVLRYVATISAKQGKLEEAEETFETVLANKMSSLGAKHVKCASSMNDLGSVQRQLGKEDAAKKNFNKSISILESEHGRSHISLASVLNNLGMVLKEQGDLTEAKGFYERSLRIQEQTHGDDHINCADIHHNIGNLLREQKDLNKAEQHFKTALTIHTKVRGKDKQYADILTSMAGNAHEAGDSVGAKQNYEKALAVFDTEMGQNHVASFEALIGLAKIHEENTDFGKAETCYRKALQAHAAAYGRKRSVYANTLSNLGFLKSAKGDIDGAKDCHSESLKIRDEIFGKDHISSGVPLNNLGLVIRDLGDYIGAMALFEHALHIYSINRYPSNHPIVATILNNLRETDELIHERGTAAFRLKSTSLKPK